MATFALVPWMLFACAALHMVTKCTDFAHAHDLKRCQVPPLEDIAERPTAFYDCAESMMQCGEDGYFQRYASKYALKHQKYLKALVSEEGKQFVDNFTFCLQYYMRARAEKTIACANLPALVDEFAGICYLTSGLCEIPLVDTLLWAKTIDWVDLPVMTFAETTHALYFQCNRTTES
eukprot:scaffold148_cov341-Pavlova_lutheri.AAC.54